MRVRMQGIAILFSFFWAGLVFAQTAMNDPMSTYPNKPIRIIIPLAAGNSIDSAVRILTQKMAQSMGQSFVIETLPGAAGIIGTDKVAKPAPDGYTLGAFNDSILTMVPNFPTKIPWDPVKDFEPISLVALIELGLVVSPNATEKTASDLIASAKAAPGQINYGSGGNGSPQHVAIALLNAQAGTTMTHVPYKGIMQAASGVAAGEVQTALIAVASLKGLADAGKLKFIGVASSQRLASFPNIPTISETGLPGYEFTAWFAFLAPKGTPASILKKINSETLKALADPEVKAQLTKLGLEPVGSNPEELAKKIKDQLSTYGAVIKKAAIKAD